METQQLALDLPELLPTSKTRDFSTGSSSCPDCRWTTTGLWPSEGSVAVRWIEDNLILPEGDTFGEPFKLRPDQKRFLYRWYEYCGGCKRWRYTEAMLEAPSFQSLRDLTGASARGDAPMEAAS